MRALWRLLAANRDYRLLVSAGLVSLVGDYALGVGLTFLVYQITGSTLDQTYVEIVELDKAEHPYFLGCQFHPEFKSKPFAPHPLFSGFVRAAAEYRDTRVEAKTIRAVQ